MLAMLALHRQLPALACTKLRSKAHMVAVTNVLAKLLRYGKRLTNALATHTHTSPRTEPSRLNSVDHCTLQFESARKAHHCDGHAPKVHRVGIKLQNHTTHEAERG